MPGQSRRLSLVQDPIIPIVGRWLRDTPGAISLGQGLVSYGPPPEAAEAVRRFLEHPEHRYGAVEGERDLVDLLEQKLRAENGIAAAPLSRVVVTAGGNMAFMNAILAIADTGDEVILPVPFYFNHEMAIVMAGAVPVAVPTTHDYQLDLDAIAAAITPRTRAVVTISPNNPSGAVYPEGALRALNALCARHGIFHVHDEVYEYFTYDGARHFSPGSIDGAAAHTISLYSLSKAYGFASWRIGYMVIPEALWMAVNKIQDTLLICPPLVSQAAAAAALRVGRAHSAPHIDALRDVRRLVFDAFDMVRDEAEVPAVQGAFYALVDVKTPLSPMACVERLIRDHGVAAIPGSAFGLTRGCVLRVSYGALARDTVVEGMRRLTRGIRAIAQA
jgi:aspartate/methionine/tyrosine aminotransferase